jgi:replicative DNA helicase
MNTNTTKSEEALLGAVILEGNLFPQAQANIDERYFSNGKLAKIWELCRETYDQAKALDLILLVQEAKNRGMLAQFGGELYLSALLNCGLPGHLRYYIAEIKKGYFYRQQLKAAEKFKQDSDAEKLLKAFNEAQREISILQNSKALPIAEVAHRFLDEIEHPLDIIKTGFSSIDRGSAPAKGDLFVLAAREQVGKSVVCINLIKKFLEDGRKVLVYTTEMSPEQYFRRQVALYTDVPYVALKFHKFSELGDFHKIMQFLSNFTEKYKDKLIFSTISHPTSADIRAEIERVKPDIMVLDNLSGAKLPKGYDNKTDRIAEYADDIKDALIEHNCLGVLVCHLNRDSLKAQAEPETSNIKDCSHLEEIASQVLLLWVDKGSTNDISDYKKIYWKLAKDRDGFGGRGAFMLNRKNLAVCEEGEEK